MTATKQPPVYGDNLPITTFQIKHILKLCQFNKEFKCAVVASHTGQTSLKKITQKQAVNIIRSFENSRVLAGSSAVVVPENWATFDKSNQKHRVILSCMYQAQWTVPSDKHGEIPDMERLSNFLKSDRSPVKKPLKDMQLFELEKVIAALNGIIKSIHK